MTLRADTATSHVLTTPLPSHPPPPPAVLKAPSSKPYRPDDQRSFSATSGESQRTSNSIDLEKDALQNKTQHGHVRSPRSSRSLGNNPVQRKYAVHGLGEVEQEAPLSKALKILIFMSGPLSALCFGTLVWTLIALIYSTVVQSCRAVTGKQNFRGHLLALLDPAYRYQLRCIYSAPHTSEYALGKLLTINFLSPILSMAMIVAGIVAALFWACSAIVGNPGDSEGTNDAREAVMTLRRWWHAWLSTITLYE